MSYTVFLVENAFQDEAAGSVQLEKLSWETVLALLQITKAQDLDVVIRLEKAGD